MGKPLQQRHKERDDEVQRDGQLLGSATKPLARTSSLHPDPFRCEQDHNRPQTSKNSFNETEKLLQKWKHPDPYRPPTAPGGSKYERNLAAPDLPPPSREFVKRL